MIPTNPGSVRLTELMLLGMVLIWGVNFSVVKYGALAVDQGGRNGPLAYNGLRVALAAATLVAVALAMSRRWPTRRDALRLLGLGVIGNGLYQIFFIEGIARTRAGTAALVLASGPAIIALIGRARGVERISRRGWAGILLQLAGMACVVLGSVGGAAAGAAGAAGAAAARIAGDLLMLAGCVCWAFFTVALQPYTHRVQAIQLSALTMVGGALPLLAFSAPSLVATQWGRVPPLAWGAIVYSGLGALVVAYLLWYHGVRVLGPTRTAMFGNLQPIVALLVAWALLGEVPTTWQGVGTVGIVGGLFLARA